MKNRRIKSLILIAASILLISSCGKEQGGEKIIRPVKIMEIKNSDAVEYFSFSGITTPSKEIILSFKIAGPLESMNLTQGQSIKKDEVLAKMDSRDYIINLEVYRKKYEAAKASADNAVLQYNRAEKLYRADAMTKKNFDMVTAQKKAAVSLLKEAQQGVENAQNKLKDTELKAPYSGYISRKFVDAGSVVNAGTPVVSLSAEDNPEVTISIASKDIDTLKNAVSFTFVPNDSEEKEYQLKLKEIGKNPEFSKLTYPVVFELLNADGIRMGMSGKVTASVKRNDNSPIIIPASALFEDNGSKVYIYENGTAKTREVKIGNLYPDGNIIILEGLNKNDKVITAGVNTISDGEKVKLIPEESETNVGNVL
ncbi:MAG: efflux RND transporter periplasmic adaptor subunit [Fusobacterium ulcerans]|uniref:efflux RND transporter periplasmic adaptor subunit n=1 Tax=Fusobacterium ulcerans TaxID=861 RepID=UPI003A8C12A2